MPYDPGLAERKEDIIGLHPDMEDKKMIGGMACL